jgi:hypothetical protein
MTVFGGKKYYTSLSNFFLYLLKNKIMYNFVKFVASKKGTVRQQIFVFGSGIHDPEWIKESGDPDPGSYL